jgi:acetoin utilization deacetylase AcuC-like enzyme
MTTAFITHKDCLGHITPDQHPETKDRLISILKAIEDIDNQDLVRESAPLGNEKDILRVHPLNYIKKITSESPSKGIKALDADTFMSPGSLTAAYRSVGAVVRAVDLVMGKKVSNAFAAIRPPGHHAEKETSMGFCFFGNVAIAASYALEHYGLSRVAVVDFDVHHGNGTQDLLWDETRTLFVSSHQSPLWPGTGRSTETGGSNNIINLPLDPNTDGKEFRAIYEKAVFPALESFSPELIIISAGFDAHIADPLANLNFTNQDFEWVTERLCDVADFCCGGRIVSTLEGGYDLEALAASVKLHLEVLLRRGH